MPQQTYGLPLRQQILGPCFHCLEMGHLKATCQKLNKQYPFEPKAREPSHYVCDVYKGSESKLVGNIERLVIKPVNEPRDLNKGVLSTKVVEPDTELIDEATTSKVVSAAEQPPIQGECSELEPDLSRCWEFEQDTTQISDVQGRLCTCLSFWEQVLEAPPPVLEYIKLGFKLPLLSIYIILPEAQPQICTN